MHVTNLSCYAVNYRAPLISISNQNFDTVLVFGYLTRDGTLYNACKYNDISVLEQITLDMEHKMFDIWFHQTELGWTNVRHIMNRILDILNLKMS